MQRALKAQILADLSEKMVFLAGPRQVGKTTLAKSLYKNCEYLNWDIDEGRSRILTKSFRPADLWIFDEIHKFKTWRNYLKGLYDDLGKKQKIIVTGSAKLDVLRKGGDSLQGRYHPLRLMPLSFAELGMKTEKEALDLFRLSGFPEPFLSQSETKCNRWSRSYRERIIRQEVSTNEQIVDLGNMEILFDRLRDTVGGTLSIHSLAQDIQISDKTIAKWIAALERLYAVFRVSPFGAPRIKAVKKRQKIFYYDWNAISDVGGRFENFVAVHLIKWIFSEQDLKGRSLDLRFYRDKYDREVDFIVTENQRPILFIEAKHSQSEISKGLVYLKSKFPPVRAMQVYMSGKKESANHFGIENMNVVKLLSELNV